MAFHPNARSIRAAAGWLRPALALGVLVASAVLLSQRFQGTDVSEIMDLIGSIPAERWALAVLFTALSFAAVGLYDVAVHRWLKTGIPGYRAGTSGAAAIAVSQIVGFGLVTGTLARWQFLPALRLERAAQITAVVAASFAAALVVSIAIAGLLVGLPEATPLWVIPLGFAILAGVIVLSLAQPRRLPIRLPSVRVIGGILGATLADTILAGLALWVLLPDPSVLAPAVLIPAFMIAMGAGLTSGTPAGAGAFELTLLWLLVTVPEADLLAAILAFRLVYYGLPAVFGGLALVATGLRGRTDPQVAPSATSTPSAAAPRAEAGLVRQGEFDWRAAGPGHVLAAETGQTLVGVGDPATGGADPTATVAAFGKSARAIGLSPALYKCSGRSAVAARRIGWRLFHIADEMWLDPRSFRLDTPPRARLRRKLRAAAKKGLEVTPATSLPLADMGAVAEEWATDRGGERGFSMGRWDPDYVAGQRVFLARQDGRLVAFATFHDAPHEWTLDLMRTARDAPDGTMHTLVDAAIRRAAEEEIPRLSLAALPSARLVRAGQRLRWQDAGAHGLKQFKAAFAPHREPLYISAPSHLAMALALLDIRRRITRPVALRETIRPDPEESAELAAASP